MRNWLLGFGTVSPTPVPRTLWVYRVYKLYQVYTFYRLMTLIGLIGFKV